MPRSLRLIVPPLCLALWLSARETSAARRLVAHELVEVRLTQIELTVWPEDGNPAACRDLAAADLRLEVNGKPREIVGLDRDEPVATPERTEAVVVGAGAGAPVDDPLTLVAYFDLWHLELFRECCGATKHLAFEQARRMVHEAMRPGDRLLMVTFAGWPVVHGGWFRNPRDALAALDRLEVSPVVTRPRFDHSHHQQWVKGLESFLLALGRYPERKEVLYLGDDIEIADVLERVREIGARAQANRVVMNAVDLAWGCRNLFCTRACPAFCNFRSPAALGPLSWTTGGRLFKTGTVTEAVERLRGAVCRYVLSFRTTEADTRRAPRIDVAIARPGLTLAAPESFEGPRRVPTDREERDALFLLPQFGRGVSVEAGLWPLRPAAKRDRWKAVVVARLRAVSDDLDGREVDSVIVRGVVHSGSKVLGEFAREISGTDLREGAATGRGKLIMFPIEVRSGEVTVAINARGPEGQVEANVRASTTVPRPPGTGEARPWLLADGVEGTLVDAAAGGRRPVPIRRLDRAGGCGFLVATLPADLLAGLWHFEPPGRLGGGDPVAFRIEGR